MANQKDKSRGGLKKEKPSEGIGEEMNEMPRLHQGWDSRVGLVALHQQRKQRNI